MIEKYGVDESRKQQDMDKAAAQGCPECGSKLEKHGSVVMCPKHGTAPFEQSK